MGMEGSVGHYWEEGLKGPHEGHKDQMWVYLIGEEAEREKLDGKSHRIILELWQQLKAEKWFQLLRNKKQRLETEPKVWPVCKTSCWRVSWPHLNPHRKIIGWYGLTEGRVEAPALEDWVGTRGHMLKYQFIGPSECTTCSGSVNTGAECSLIYGNPEHFPGTPAVIDGSKGKATRMKQDWILLGIGHVPPKEVCCVYLSHPWIYFGGYISCRAYGCRPLQGSSDSGPVWRKQLWGDMLGRHWPYLCLCLSGWLIPTNTNCLEGLKKPEKHSMNWRRWIL